MMNETRRYWINLIAFAGGALSLSLALTVLYFCWDAARDYLHPRRVMVPAGSSPRHAGIVTHEVEMISADGVRLAGWYTPPVNGVVVLSAHGYGGHRDASMHALFARNGFGVVSWDFRAHGASGGDFSTIGYYEALDVEAALDFALAQPGVERVAAWGGSMGGVSSILAAARRAEIEAVIIDSAFTSLEEELDVMVHAPALRPLVRFFAEAESGVNLNQVRPLDQIGRIAPRPVLIIHGEGDFSVPAQAGQRLYAAAGEPRSLWLAPRVGHMGAFLNYPQEYEQRVIGFLESIFGLK